MYTIVYTKAAVKDVQLLKSAHLADKAKKLIEVISNNPFQNPPPYEKLLGNLNGLYSRRLNRQHRLVYQVLPDTMTIKIISMWSHYETV